MLVVRTKRDNRREVCGTKGEVTKDVVLFFRDGEKESERSVKNETERGKKKEREREKNDA